MFLQKFTVKCDCCPKRAIVEAVDHFTANNELVVLGWAVQRNAHLSKHFCPTHKDKVVQS